MSRIGEKTVNPYFQSEALRQSVVGYFNSREVHAWENAALDRRRGNKSTHSQSTRLVSAHSAPCGAKTVWRDVLFPEISVLEIYCLVSEKRTIYQHILRVHVLPAYFWNCVALRQECGGALCLKRSVSLRKWCLGSTKLNQHVIRVHVLSTHVHPFEILRRRVVGRFISRKVCAW